MSGGQRTVCRWGTHRCLNRQGVWDVKGRGQGRGREPVGRGKGEGQESYACLPSLPWPPVVQDSSPKVSSLCHSSPKADKNIVSFKGRGKKQETSQI